MNKYDDGFTLLEMLMVVFIIATLLILTIPNITKHKDNVEGTSCDAYVDIVQTQEIAYELENETVPSISELQSAGYIDSAECSDGRSVAIDGEGNVSIN